MPKILLVDDDEAIRKIYARFLRGEGFEVLESRNGEHALMEFSKENLDVVLLDIQMPVASGRVVISALQYFHPSAKIIIASCYPVDVQRKMIDSAQDYFDKADGCQKLLSKIKPLLSAKPNLYNSAHIK